MKRALMWIQENGLQKDPKAMEKYIKFINKKNEK